MKKEKNSKIKNQTDEKSDNKREWESEKIEETNEKTPAPSSKENSAFKKGGELAVDVYGTEDHIVIQAPIGGVKRNELEIVTEKDMVIIKGKRDRPQEKEIKVFYTQECFYGNFRREVVLPEETDPSRLEADIKDGVLTVKAPKIEREKRRKVDI